MCPEKILERKFAKNVSIYAQQCSGEYRPGPQWALERNELSMTKSAIVWRRFHNHQSITSAHSSNLFFGAADPGDETYDRLSWDKVKLAADLVLDEGFDEEQFFNNPSGPAFSSHPTCQDVIPVKDCTKIDMDDVLEERRLPSTPRNGTLKNPGPDFSRLSPQVNALMTRLSERNTYTYKAKVSSSIPSSVDYALGRLFSSIFC